MTLSISPGLPELLRIAMDKSNEALFVALPGKVEKYDPSTQTASIKPLLKRKEEAADGTYSVDTLGVIDDVPVAHPRGGGNFVHFPLKAGDNVLLVFCDRSIDDYVESDGRTDIEPKEARTNDISDAVAIPGFYPTPKALTNVNSNDFIFGREDNRGIVKISSSGVVDVNNGNLVVQP